VPFNIDATALQAAYQLRLFDGFIGVVNMQSSANLRASALNIESKDSTDFRIKLLGRRYLTTSKVKHQNSPLPFGAADRLTRGDLA
jgi:hypothetical protein